MVFTQIPVEPKMTIPLFHNRYSKRFSEKKYYLTEHYQTIKASAAVSIVSSQHSEL